MMCRLSECHNSYLTSQLGERNPDIQKSAIERQRDGQPGEYVADPQDAYRGSRYEPETEKDGRDRQALYDGLQLAGGPCPERLTLTFQMAAQTLNQDLADDDRRDHPGQD